MKIVFHPSFISDSTIFYIYVASMALIIIATIIFVIIEVNKKK